MSHPADPTGPAGPAGGGPAEVLRVDLSALSAEARGAHAAVIASLPELFRGESGHPKAGPASDIEVIDGSRPSWPGAIAHALGESRRGVVISAPTTVPAGDVSDLAGRAEEAGCPVVVALPFQFDSTVRDGLSVFRAEGIRLSLVDSVVTVPAGGNAGAARSRLRGGLLAQIAAIQASAGPFSGLKFRHDTADAYIATGRATGLAGSAPVMLTGLVSALPPHGLRADLVGISGRHTIRIHENPVAAPTLFESSTASGLNRLRLSYTSGLRAAWRNVHAAATASEPVHYGLRELAHDLAVLP